MKERMEEFKTNDKGYSRSPYLRFQGVSVGNKGTGEVCEGDYTVNGDISRFKGGLLHGGGQPAIERLDGHTEWWAEGFLHRENGPAVITLNGTWEEYWYYGELVMIRVYGAMEMGGEARGG